VTPPAPLGHPRLHLRRTTSTNERARALAESGAPHGTVVTASEQTAGRGRQGRTWMAPPGRSLLVSVLVRDPPRLLPLAAGAAVAGAADEALAVADATAAPGATAAPTGPAGAARLVQIKWPNDVLLDGGKVAGILVEGRPQEGWAVVGIGLNVAVAESDFPPELAGRAATLGLGPEDIEPTLRTLLARLEHWLAADAETLLTEIRARDALLGRPVRWAGGEGRGDGIDGDGRLVVLTAGGGRVALDAGEVHLG
jgi:BirA family biotin operon repressor/biotin-[acetyl-CoA-carboxylase] ligase